MSVFPPRWDVLSIEGVPGVIERAARKLHRVRDHTTEFSDLVQEATIRTATTADLIATIEDEDGPQLGLLYTRLYRDLLNMTERDDRQLGSRLSYERLIEDFKE